MKLKNNSALFFRLRRDDLVFFIGTTVAGTETERGVRNGGVRVYEVAARRSARRRRLTDDLFQ